MDIRGLSPINKSSESDFESFDEDIESISKSSAGILSDAQTKQAIDQATGLLQAIVSDKISDDVIRKMPSDEYSRLLSLLDEIISGSIDKHV